jgi:hypothetical protein
MEFTMRNVPGWDGDGECITALYESVAIPYKSIDWDLSEELKKPVDPDNIVIYKVSPPKNKVEVKRLADATMFARHYGVRFLLTGDMKDYPVKVRVNVDSEYL